MSKPESAQERTEFPPVWRKRLFKPRQEREWHRFEPDRLQEMSKRPSVQDQLREFEPKFELHCLLWKDSWGADRTLLAARGLYSLFQNLVAGLPYVSTLLVSLVDEPEWRALSGNKYPHGALRPSKSTVRTSKSINRILEQTLCFSGACRSKYLLVAFNTQAAPQEPTFLTGSLTVL
ncbi:hypothetical protein C8J57DRAFT_1221055 [Mycena rebaudengoi]|nr:hypothetical protein C8J57DRAFT_1221055 [Mycena rebaudengoi]